MNAPIRLIRVLAELRLFGWRIERTWHDGDFAVRRKPSNPRIVERVRLSDGPFSYVDRPMEGMNLREPK